jgi:hypothetical protein
MRARPRVSLPVLQDTGEPLPVREDDSRRASEERDPWCHRANACLDAIVAHDHGRNDRTSWRGFSCRACSVKGTDQESTAERLAGLALMQAEGPEIGAHGRVAVVKAAHERYRAKRRARVA